MTTADPRVSTDAEAVLKALRHFLTYLRWQIDEGGRRVR